MSIWSEEEKAKDIVEEIWDYVCSENLVIANNELGELMERCRVWEKNGWPEAGVYHEGTRDYPFVDMSRKDAFNRDNERMKEYESDWTAPDCYQTFSAVKSISLTKLDGQTKDYLASRSQNRDKLRDLSVFFDFCFGERLRLEHAYDEQNFLQLESLRKTIPSGGGRHPTEAFFLVLDNGIGLEAGLYHYNVKNNSLDLLKQDLIAEDLGFEGEKAQALLILTSICERAMWRYRDPRSWRAIVIDIGHAEEMGRLIASALGYEIRQHRLFDAEKIAALLGVDPFRQPPMSLASLSAKGES
ncbi:MAG: SagB/ThcOx family dehydrogenase [Candidatus Obscuribacterales bacterium]|nr:SagB/ThcOx family dehydrogenase [Candidatus Obscuribacterales bacterium]